MQTMKHTSKGALKPRGPVNRDEHRCPTKRTDVFQKSKNKLKKQKKHDKHQRNFSPSYPFSFRMNGP